MSTPYEDSPELRMWIVRQTEAGHAPDALLSELIAKGYNESTAVTIMTETLQTRLEEIRSSRSTRDAGVTHNAGGSAAAEVSPHLLPQPLGKTWPTVLHAFDRDVNVLVSLMCPRVIVFGGLLSHAECDDIVALARIHMKPSKVVDMESGGEKPHAARTSSGTALAREGTPLIARIERRIAALLNWPLENGEALQILRYDVGQEYKPHYDYVDPAQPGAAPFLARGGQRVASLVMYLNTPKDGGGTNFPDARLEVAAVKGNAVFFSYDRPHPSTKTLHGGMPVRAGEKWVATKWLREHPHF